MLHAPSQVAFTDSEGDERARPSRDDDDDEDEEELIVLDPDHVCDFTESESANHFHLILIFSLKGFIEAEVPYRVQVNLL